MKFNDVSEEDFETERILQKMRERLLKKYSDVFKSDLGPKDRIRIDPIKVETIENIDNFKAHSAFTPIEITIFLQKLLSKMIKAGFLEPVDHTTT